MTEQVLGLNNFIKKSPTIYHCVENIKNELLNKGFREVKDNEKFNLKGDEKFFVTREDSCLMAFDLAKDTLIENGLRIVGSHGDSPCFKLKPNFDRTREGYIMANVECYGGPILSTWFDRALSLAGKIYIDNGNGIEEKLINVEKPILTMPNMAIHLNRAVNDGYKYDKQRDTQPICGFEVPENIELPNSLTAYIEEKYLDNNNKLVDYELYLYDALDGNVIGINDELFQISRLDDLMMAYTSMEAFLQSDEATSKVLLCTNNEEVGSNSFSGSISSFVENTLERVFLSYGYTKEEYLISLYNSRMMSADLAHAVHPNYADKHDPINHPKLGQGMVIKYSANERYSTSAEFAAKIKRICDSKNIPLQKFVNPSNVVGGSTIGPYMSSKLGIPALDIGAPLLGMHSIRELCGVADIDYSIKTFEAFYSWR